MVADREPRAVAERLVVRVDERLRVGQRPRHLRLDDGDAVPLGDEARQVLEGRIGVVGDDDPVARQPAERAQHRVRAGRRVLDECEL